MGIIQHRFMEEARRWLHTPYGWGGDDPEKIDCSGYVIECLKSVGVLPRRGDWTANMLWHKFKDAETSEKRGGDLVFFLKNDRAFHVGIYIGDGLCYSAAGGGSDTNTVEDAMDHNAWIKQHPVLWYTCSKKYCRII